ncbi:MAG: hypothetical protein OEM18_07715 [Nitrosopumilus sp.]|nr:hypothetical protein [Nitrosopumilus sp.]
MFFVAPLGFLLHRFVNHSNRITTLEGKMDKLDKIDQLCHDVQYIKGLLDEHLRK